MTHLLQSHLFLTASLILCVKGKRGHVTNCSSQPWNDNVDKHTQTHNLNEGVFDKHLS